MESLRGSMEGYMAYMARITAYGVDVVKETTPSPITITIDQSVNVCASQNVQMINSVGV